jgi:serine/threonine protein kinase
VSERAPPPEPLPEGTRLDDKYVIVRHIKTGGMGAVYEVEHTGLGKKLAAKLLLPDLSRRPELLERFRREARAASATGHENIVEVTDLGETKGGVPFLVMELLQGRTLGAELKNGRLPPERAVHITRQMLSALKAAHTRGIVHRDLKPENIFLIQRANDPDFVKVLDFGIAKLLTEEVGEELTRAGQVVGTPTYMAPEQARGAEIDARADLYAVGAILYRMVTGNRPFTAPNFNSLLFAIAQGNATPPRQVVPEVSASLESAIQRAMQIDPRARFQSADDFDEALSEEDRTEQKLPAPINFPTGHEDSKPEWSQRSATMMGANSGSGVVGRAISGAMTLAIVAGVLVILGGATWLVLRRVIRLRNEAEIAREAEAARARVLAAPRPEFVAVTLDVDPAAARLTLDGAQVAPGKLDIVKDGGRHVLRAEADGYATEERPFLASSDQKIMLKLKKRRPGQKSPKSLGPTQIGDSQTDDKQVKQLENLIKKLGEAASEE